MLLICNQIVGCNKHFWGTVQCIRLGHDPRRDLLKWKNVVSQNEQLAKCNVLSNWLLYYFFTTLHLVLPYSDNVPYTCNLQRIYIESCFIFRFGCCFKPRTIYVRYSIRAGRWEGVHTKKRNDTRVVRHGFGWHFFRVRYSIAGRDGRCGRTAHALRRE